MANTESSTLRHNAFRETMVIAARGLRRYTRLPQLLFFTSAQPIMILFVFDFVFSGMFNSAVPGGKYIDFLLPGLLVQMVMFGGVQTGIGLAEDMSAGIIDRFRSLPMSSIAVIAGRTLSDAVRNIVALLIMVVLGYGLGFRFHGAVLDASAMLGLNILFGYVLSWAFAFIGMAVKNAGAAEAASMVLIFPLSFASSAFVPVSTMPHWLRIFAVNQPVTFLVDASRSLALGISDNGATWKLLLWCGALFLIFVPLAVGRYRRIAE